MRSMCAVIFLIIYVQVLATGAVRTVNTSLLRLTPLISSMLELKISSGAEKFNHFI